jgi:Zn-dependent peptidase ImmA (M78 family)
LAARARVSEDDVRAWREGTARPGKTEFKVILQAVRRPSAIFFMPEPPVRAALPTTFRAAPGARDHTLSPAALRAIRRARRIQRAVGWLYAGADLREPVGLPKVAWETQDARKVGATLRASFAVPLDTQAGWKDFGEALRSWRGLFDERGVLVFSLELGKDEIRGFSAWHDYAPLIAVNTGYTPGARIFTLAHELAHLVTRTDSACFDWISSDVSHDPKLERWCEEFAAAFLLPPDRLAEYATSQFLVSPQKPVTTFDLLSKMSQRLKVSARAMALALIEGSLADWSLYREVELRAKTIDRPPEGSGGGGVRAPQKRINQYGTRAPRALVEAVSGGRLGLRDAADYLELTIGDLDDLGMLLRGQPLVGA